jgi:hypothetical protein
MNQRRHGHSGRNGLKTLATESENPKMRFRFPDCVALLNVLTAQNSWSPAERGEMARVELISKLKTEGAPA